MRRIKAAALAGLLSLPFLAAPASAQPPNVQQFLQGLLSGNQGQDQALREAFERGYRRGREDEARLRADRDRGDRAAGQRPYPRDDADRGSGYDRDRRGYRDERGRDQPYPDRRGGYDDR